MKPSKPNAVDKPVEKVDYVLILGVRRLKTGSFAGLWELTELNADGSVKRVLTDANTRSIVINLAGREIGKAL